VRKPARLIHGLVGVAVVIAIFVSPAGAQPRGAHRNFLGMHNLKGGGVTPFQTRMDWTKTLVARGFIMDWVTDFAPLNRRRQGFSSQWGSRVQHGGG